MSLIKIAILISGRGSNMVALADAIAAGSIPNCEIAVVISDKPDAPGLIAAAERGLDAVVIERGGRGRAEHDEEIIAELKLRTVDLVCLAGYMRLLSPSFITSFPGRIINIHPSLLPDFPGLDAQRQALEAGAIEAGCTVHIVDELVDHGPVILQKRVDIVAGDTPESLSARILEQEHTAYVEAVSMIASGKWPIVASPAATETR